MVHNRAAPCANLYGWSFSPVLLSVSMTGFRAGTGSIFIICLFLINNLDLLKSSATSKIFNGVECRRAGRLYYGGHIAFLLSIPMIAASLLGNHLGSQHAIRTNGEIVRKILILTVGIMMVTLLINLFR